jgi:hypothetical protein
MDLRTYLLSRHDALGARVKALDALHKSIPSGTFSVSNVTTRNVLLAMLNADTAESNEILRQLRELKKG